MKKYPLEIKLEAIAYVLEEGHSFKSASKRYGMTAGDVQKWVNLYEHHGIQGVTNRNGSYSGDFRVRVVEYKREEGLSARKAAAIFNIPSFKTIRDWERIYDEKGVEYLRQEMRGRSKGMPKKKPYKASADAKTAANKELLKENESLRMENEYLKKLYALIQENKITTRPRR